MVFPVVAARITGRSGNTDVTSHAVTMPAGIVAGNLLLVVFTSDGAPTVTAATGGWTKLNQASSTTVVTGAVFYKIATGGDALTLTTSAGEQSSHVSFRITGAGTPTATSTTGTTANTDPPAHTPPAGSRDYLWIATRSGDSTTVATAAPASYANLQSQAAQGTSGASTNTAERSLTAAVENPGTFTSAAIAWVAWTIAVPPANATVVPAVVASTATVGAPTLVVPQVRNPLLVSAAPTVGLPTVPTHYPLAATAAPAVFTPAAPATTTVPAAVASAAVVGTPTTATTVTRSAALVASSAVVALPVVIGTQVLTPSTVPSTAAAASPTVATHYPPPVASTATVATPTVATHYPTPIASTATVPEPTVVLRVAAATAVNRPAPLKTSTSLAPSTTLTSSAGGDRVFPPAVTVLQSITVLPALTDPSEVVEDPSVAAGPITAAPQSVTSTATVGAPTLDTITQYEWPQFLTRAVTTSPGLAPSAGLFPTAGLSTVHYPRAWVGSPQTVDNVETVASTATVRPPDVAAYTLLPLSLRRELVTAPDLATSSQLLPTAGLSRVHAPAGSTAVTVFPATVLGALYPAPDLYPAPWLRPAKTETFPPAVQVGAVHLAPDPVTPGSVVHPPTPSGSGVNYVPLYTPQPIPSGATVAAPTVWVDALAVAVEFVDSEETVELPNVVLSGELLVLPVRAASAGGVFAPTVSQLAVQVTPALVAATSVVRAPQVATPSLQTLTPAAVPSTVVVARPRPPGGTPTRPRPGVPVVAAPVRAGPPTAVGVAAAPPPRPASVVAGVPVPA